MPYPAERTPSLDVNLGGTADGVALAKQSALFVLDRSYISVNGFLFEYQAPLAEKSKEYFYSGGTEHEFLTDSR